MLHPDHAQHPDCVRGPDEVKALALDAPRHAALHKSHVQHLVRGPREIEDLAWTMRQDVPHPDHVQHPILVKSHLEMMARTFDTMRQAVPDLNHVQHPDRMRGLGEIEALACDTMRLTV